ncbi:MAG: GLUG motif-containing protein [Planctomycetota bacterium]
MMEVRKSGILTDVRQVLRTIPLLITIFSLSIRIQAQYGGGMGEPNDPYLIYTAEQMNAIGAEPNDWDKHFKLMADIDLSIYTGTDFNIIGYTGTDLNMFDRNNTFTGVFDGNGHIISNFSYTSTDKRYIGLFGCVGATVPDAIFAIGKGKDAMIKDLELIEPNVDAGIGDDVGALVGGLGLGTITNCSVKGGTVSGNRSVGGLVGGNFGGEITNCYVTGKVEGVNDVGGLVGINHSNYGKRAEITNCYSVGSITGNESVGGLVGHNQSVSSVFTVRATISNCYSIGNVFGIEHIGGLVGENIGGGLIIKCYATGRVTGTTVVGGLVGENMYSYSPSSFTASFWDIETSGRSNMCGIEGFGGSGCDDVNGKTTAEMQTAATFLEAGWDFLDEIENGTEDIWWILEGQSYPRLWWEYGLAFSPYPQDGAIDVIRPVILNWLPGGSDLSHDVYFSDDEEAVANATTENSGIYCGRLSMEVPTYEPGILEWGKTYYWRIDEVDEDDPNSPWKGNVWSFTTADFIVVDDFESYNDIPGGGPHSNRIYIVWLPAGYDDPVGFPLVHLPLYEKTIVHSGNRSIAFFYDNAIGNFEATKTLTYTRDWTIEGVGVLSLWFYGAPNNAAEPMYVALNNSAVVYHDNPDAVLIDDWTEWRIDLQEFADHGVDLTNINTISIGFGNRTNPVSGGSGIMYFDDIRLYRPDTEPAQ